MPLTSLSAKRIGPVIARLRVAKGFTQESLAGHAGVTRNTVQSLENGRHQVAIRTLEWIADALDISVQEIARLAETAPSPARIELPESLYASLADAAKVRQKPVGLLVIEILTDWTNWVASAQAKTEAKRDPGQPSLRQAASRRHGSRHGK